MQICQNLPMLQMPPLRMHQALWRAVLSLSKVSFKQPLEQQSTQIFALKLQSNGMLQAICGRTLPWQNRCIETAYAGLAIP